MSRYIGDELEPCTIRVTTGADRVFSVELLDDDGAPLSWAGELVTAVTLVVQLDQPVRIPVPIVANLAEVRIESDIADQVDAYTKWQLLMSQPGLTVDDPTVETALLVGTFERQDGDAAG